MRDLETVFAKLEERGSYQRKAALKKNFTGTRPVDLDSKTDGRAFLTEKQRQFVVNIVEHGMTKSAACRAAGYSLSSPAVSTQTFDNPKIQKAIAIKRAEYAKASQMTRQKVIDGFSEAIEMAKVQGDPIVMVAGWREIGKMCGFYEPAKTKLEVTVNGQIALEKIQTLSDAELLALAEEGGNGLPALEGQFRASANPDPEPDQEG
jgi:hypothetical protein